MTHGDVLVHESWGQRAVFATGAARALLAEEVERLGRSRVLVVVAEGERELADRVTEGLPVVATFTGVRQHVPMEVAEEARRVHRDSRADVVVTVGGGSTTGTGKAVALTEGAPLIAVPTTYAGSEATPVWGITDEGRKTTGVDASVLPKSVVYDAALTTSLPPGLTTSSALNALAHCVDSWWAPRANPLSAALAAEGARQLVDALPAVRQDGADLRARQAMLLGSYVAAVAFAGAGSGMHHKICHALGGAFALDHAAMHAVVLPHVAGYNLPASADARRRLSSVFPGSADPFDALLSFYTSVEAPRSLAGLGLAEPDVERAAELAAEQIPSSNPRPAATSDVADLLWSAWRGEPARLIPVADPDLGEKEAGDTDDGH
ncbi:maleylacetate reductase [Streptomyces montanus]|uniref:Maleylacetate reductase n=1 Tax=Streptomyces montanus TaxID=2580423 RepID=A0A5R9FRJ2_9ACTN|nr:maleylacetate reductase [Streptomyces montanus]TLS46592.1 maleylacetate reductase [Streptomyces montanus]